MKTGPEVQETLKQAKEREETRGELFYAIEAYFNNRINLKDEFFGDLEEEGFSFEQIVGETIEIRKKVQNVLTTLIDNYTTLFTNLKAESELEKKKKILIDYMFLASETEGGEVVSSESLSNIGNFVKEYEGGILIDFVELHGKTCEGHELFYKHGKNLDKAMVQTKEKQIQFLDSTKVLLAQAETEKQTKELINDLAEEFHSCLYEQLKTIIVFIKKLLAYDLEPESLL